MAAVHVTTQGAAITSVAVAAITFSAYTPQLNDLIIFYPSSQSTVAAVSDAVLNATGWFNPLGDAVEVNGTAHGAMAVYHQVTQAEVDAATTTYSVTPFTGSELGYVHGSIWRGHNTAAPILSFGTLAPASATPHDTASVSGTGPPALADGDQVLCCITKDGTGAYGAAPTGWTDRLATNTNQGKTTLSRDALTVASTTVATAQVTPSAADEWIAITLIIKAAAAVATGPIVPTMQPRIAT